MSWTYLRNHVFEDCSKQSTTIYCVKTTSFHLKIDSHWDKSLFFCSKKTADNSFYYYSCRSKNCHTTIVSSKSYWNMSKSKCNDPPLSKIKSVNLWVLFEPESCCFSPLLVMPNLHSSILQIFRIILAEWSANLCYLFRAVVKLVWMPSLNNSSFHDHFCNEKESKHFMQSRVFKHSLVKNGVGVELSGSHAVVCSFTTHSLQSVFVMPL